MILITLGYEGWETARRVREHFDLYLVVRPTDAEGVMGVSVTATLRSKQTGARLVHLAATSSVSDENGNVLCSVDSVIFQVAQQSQAYMPSPDREGDDNALIAY